jgi:hypothetical protein
VNSVWFDATRQLKCQFRSNYEPISRYSLLADHTSTSCGQCPYFGELRMKRRERSNQTIMHTTTHYIQYIFRAPFLMYHTTPHASSSHSHTLPLTLHPSLIRLLLLSLLILLLLHLLWLVLRLLLPSLRRNRRRSSPSPPTLIDDLIDLCVCNRGVLGTIVSPCLTVPDVTLGLVLSLSA